MGTLLKERLFKLLEEKESQMIEHRRWLHEHPELSFEEKETSDYIAKFYEGKDCQVERNVGGYGIKVTIDSGKPGQTLALRADFDALPIEEATGLPFASKYPGVMHACGHDAHTAYLLSLAESLIEMKSELTGRVIIIHQPAEEMPPGGAIQMIKEGVLEGVDNVIGCHVMSKMQFGNIYYHEGPTQQARAKFMIKVQGRGGHGSSPHEANDAILIASQLVVNLQSIISRRINPFDAASISIGSFDGKGQFNIIKDSVTLEGDVRSMSDKNRELIELEIQRLCDGLATTYNCEISLDYQNDYPVLMNDSALTQLVVDAINKAQIEEVNEVLDGGAQNPSEDFAYYSIERPSCFFYIGASPEGEAYPHHHPKFDIAEGSMLIAAKAMGAATLHYLGLE